MQGRHTVPVSPRRIQLLFWKNEFHGLAAPRAAQDRASFDGDHRIDARTKRGRMDAPSRSAPARFPHPPLAGRTAAR
jgi:hypothetical protein